MHRSFFRKFIFQVDIKIILLGTTLIRFQFDFLISQGYFQFSLDSCRSGSSGRETCLSIDSFPIFHASKGFTWISAKDIARALSGKCFQVAVTGRSVATVLR